MRRGAPCGFPPPPDRRRRGSLQMMTTTVLPAAMTVANAEHRSPAVHDVASGSGAPLDHLLGLSPAGGQTLNQSAVLGVVDLSRSRGPWFSSSPRSEPAPAALAVPRPCPCRR